MNKIYAYCVPTGRGTGAVRGSSVGGDVIAIALAEDGRGLGSHYCSSPGFAMHDIGFDAWAAGIEHRRHKGFTEHYPDGWEMEWVDDWTTHPGVQAAYALNQAMCHPEERSEA